MTKKNLIITIILLAVIDLLAAGWYMSRRIEASGKSQSLFDQRDSTEVIAMADTVTAASQADVFDKEQHNTYYFIANSPSIHGDETSYYTSIKHVKVRWPKKINGNDSPEELNKELIRKAFGNSQSQLKDARYMYLNTPSFNKPIGSDYHTLSKAPRIYPVYGNVIQVMVYPYMTSQRLLVMEIDKVEYNGNTTLENTTYVHYDRQNQRLLSRVDILMTDVEKETKLLKTINKKIDELNRGRGEDKQLQHALNVPAEICCRKNGILFQFKQGTISSSPIDIMIDYDKVKDFLTKDFELLVDNNDSYWVYKQKPEAEPINPSRVTKPAVQNSLAKPVVTKPVTNKHKVTPKQTKKTRYSGAKRKSGHYGRAGKRHWSRRRR
ncbi:MAG: hypothetical protein IKI10_07225 [Muribaculaceae bacterium]|nr:hypothetical protein [Muribaculaceae bacterium]